MSERADTEALGALARNELKLIWRDEVGPIVPAQINQKTMAKILINQREWKASGQSRARYQKRLQRLIKAEHSSKPQARAGSRLVREWHGQEHIVDVLPEGYRWEGKVWRSLSAIAKEITGTKWSGPRFFGVTA